MKIDIDYRARRYLDVFALPEGQINISEVRPGITCAFHRHQNQEDHWLVVGGELEVIIVDGTNASYNFTLKDGIAYRSYAEPIIGPLIIPAKMWHGYRNVTNETALLIYYVTKKYDSMFPDEERITPDALGVQFPTGVK